MDAGAATGAVGDQAAKSASKIYVQVLRQIVQLSFQIGGRIGLVIIALFTAILVLFLIHQLTIWISQNPVRAFHGSQVALTYFASGWDIGAAAYNSLREIAIILLPLFNGYAMYVAQPAIFVVIEIMVLTFSGKAYNGVLSEDTLPFLSLIHI